VVPSVVALRLERMGKKPKYLKRNLPDC